MCCKTCGNKINSKAVVCPHCGCATGYKETNGESKKGMGFWLGMFLGVIGLIIGICLYESGTKERKTFIKGWTAGFVTTIVAACIIYGAIFGLALMA